MHSHILPGIDDGAPCIESSLLLIDGLIRSGYEHLIATPHIMSDHHPNTPRTVRKALQTLRSALADRGYTIPVEAAAEYTLDEHFGALLERGDLLTLGDRFLLVETLFHDQPPNFQELLLNCPAVVKLSTFLSPSYLYRASSISEKMPLWSSAQWHLSFSSSSAHQLWSAHHRADRLPAYAPMHPGSEDERFFHFYIRHAHQSRYRLQYPVLVR